MKGTGTEVFYGLWLNSISEDLSRLNVYCVYCGRLFEQIKRGHRVMKTIPLKTRNRKKRNRKAVFSEGAPKAAILQKTEADNQGLPHVQDHNCVSEEDFSTDLLEISFYVTIEYILIHLSSDNFLGTLMMVSGNIV